MLFDFRGISIIESIAYRLHPRREHIEELDLSFLHFFQQSKHNTSNLFTFHFFSLSVSSIKITQTLSLDLCLRYRGLATIESFIH